MTIILALSNSNGRVGTCDKTCYDAKGNKCTCICNGRNHGRGHAHAATITETEAQALADTWTQNHALEPPARIRIRHIQPYYVQKLFPPALIAADTAPVL